MNILYVDTSALVKRYVKELGYSWMRRAMSARTNNRTFLSELGTLELEVAFTRKMLETSISPTERDAMVRLFHRHLARQYETLPISDQVLTRARQLVRRRDLPLRCAPTTPFTSRPSWLLLIWLRQ